MTIDTNNMSLRPALPDDEDFLYRLFSINKTDELGAWDWPEEQRDHLLRMQFTAHRQHHQTQASVDDDYIVCLQQQPVGRLILQRNDNMLLIADIIILPEFRNQGIGTAVIRNLQQQAQQNQYSLYLHVFKTNAVVTLYHRLGFETVSENDVQFQMQWRADETP